MASVFQPSLLSVLPLGVWHLQGMLGRAEQEEMRELVREIVRQAPLVTPLMPGGVPFNLRATNAGDYGWTADGQGFYYARKQPTGRAWPQIPPQIMDAVLKAASEAGFERYAPNACLINYYERGKGRLGLHRDDTRGEDFTHPVVSISLGESCVFGIGGDSKADPVSQIELQSGDVLVMGSVGRMYYHQVLSVREGTSDLLQHGGRVSLTLRRASFNRPN